MRFLAVCLVSVIAVASASYDEKDYSTYTFAHTFAKVLRADKNDVKVFDIALIPENQAGPIYQAALTDFYQGMGLKNAKELGKKLGDMVSKNLDKVTPADKAVLIGYNLASQLKALGKLNDQNAEDQAKDAAADFDKVISKTDISSPEGKLKALLGGYQAVFSRMGLNISDYAQQFLDNVSKLLA